MQPASCLLCIFSLCWNKIYILQGGGGCNDLNGKGSFREADLGVGVVFKRFVQAVVEGWRGGAWGAATRNDATVIIRYINETQLLLITAR